MDSFYPRKHSEVIEFTETFRDATKAASKNAVFPHGSSIRTGKNAWSNASRERRIEA
jgi:hypothetical protein